MFKRSHDHHFLGNYRPVIVLIQGVSCNVMIFAVIFISAMWWFFSHIWDIATGKKMENEGCKRECNMESSTAKWSKSCFPLHVKYLERWEELWQFKKTFWGVRLCAAWRRKLAGSFESPPSQRLKGWPLVKKKKKKDVLRGGTNYYNVIYANLQVFKV